MPTEGTTVPSAAADPALIPTSDSGRHLEAAAPPPAPMEPQDSIRRPHLLEPEDDLAEPSGILAPPHPPEPGPAEPRTIDENFAHLLTTLHANRPADDLQIVRDAWAFCIQQHEGQKRASGEPYIIHPLAVAQVLAEMKMDSTAIAAGLLHDAVEDTPVTSPEIARRFGDQVAHIVEGVTKLDKIKFANKEDHQAENIRKMLLAMVTDIRVVLIKMADRLHNMRTLGALRPDKQARIARETLDIYAPLAHRLGMGKLRGEFEDLSFRYVDPEAYEHLSSEVEKIREKGGEQFLTTVVRRLESELKRHGLPGRVEFRTKRLYSIQQKLPAAAAGEPIDVAQVHDLYAVRIITETMQDCYALLGLVQNLWRPVPGRIKDFIAMPRPNGYKSLHTTLVADGGHQFEVQIRTEEMHRIAEDGIAAHWKYKANETVSAKDEQRLAWVRQLMEWQREMSDPNEFMSTLKIDLYPEEVYTFTPKGKVVVLPKDASPIDFAYTIHTEVGHTTVAAKVNGRIVPLRHRLRNGDIVEITTQAGHTPSRDWLTFAKSSRARNKIKHWLNEHQRERAIEIGTKLLEREARKFDVSLRKVTDDDYTRVANEYGLGGQQDLVAGIGFGKYSARQTLNRLVPGSTAPGNEQGVAPTLGDMLGNQPGAPSSSRSTPVQPGQGQSTIKVGPSIGPGFGTPTSQMSEDAKRVYFGKGTESLQVEGQNDLLIYRARCCNPIRGEEIVGYVTRGKGVAVHARTCSNVQNLLYESDRRIQVEWSPTPEDLANQLRKQQTTSKAARFATPEPTTPVPTTDTLPEPMDIQGAPPSSRSSKAANHQDMHSAIKVGSNQHTLPGTIAEASSSRSEAPFLSSHSEAPPLSSRSEAEGSAFPTLPETATPPQALPGAPSLSRSQQVANQQHAQSAIKVGPNHKTHSDNAGADNLHFLNEPLSNESHPTSPNGEAATSSPRNEASAMSPQSEASPSPHSEASPSTHSQAARLSPQNEASRLSSRSEAEGSAFSSPAKTIPETNNPHPDPRTWVAATEGKQNHPNRRSTDPNRQNTEPDSSNTRSLEASQANPKTQEAAQASTPQRRSGDSRSEVRQIAPPPPKPTRFPVRLVITCDDRSGMLKQLTATISDDDTNIRSVDSKSNPDRITANVEFVIETLDLSHLTKLTANLRRLPGVREVHRVSKL